MTRLDWSKRKRADHGPAALIGECPECGRQGAFHLVALSRSHRPHLIHSERHALRWAVMCPRCTYGVELLGDEIPRAADLVLATADWRAERLRTDEYHAALGWLLEKLGD